MSWRRGAILGPQKSRSSSRTCLLLLPIRWIRSANTKRVSSGAVPSLCDDDDSDDGIAPGGGRAESATMIYSNLSTTRGGAYDVVQTKRSSLWHLTTATRRDGK